MIYELARAYKSLSESRFTLTSGQIKAMSAPRLRRLFIESSAQFHEVFAMLTRVTITILLMGGLSVSGFAQPKRLTNFDATEKDVRWQVVNDTVMGGRSDSRIQSSGGLLEFSGKLNTKGGGFVSLRSDRQDWRLPEFSLVRLRLRGDGREYGFRLYADGDRAAYQREFATVAGEWQEVVLPIDEFYASWRGRRLTRPPLSSSKIVGMGLILADGVDGSFRLTLDWIEFDGAQLRE